jgi:hypothetical protein
MTRRLALAALVALLTLAGVTHTSTRPAAAQTAGYRVVFVGDISPPTNETKGDDHATAELIAKLNPDLVCLLGDVQYETGSGAMFASPVGFEGSYGRLIKPKVRCPAVGNHDVADPGPGAPGLVAYFADALTGLPCESDPVPCQPSRGYYVIDLDANRDGTPDWFVTVLDSNCQRASGGTGDVQTPSCADNGEQANWLRSVYNARHGGATSGRKCSLAVWHHERFGTGFFADDPATQYLWGVLNHYHADVVFSGHTHSVARMGAMTYGGTLSPTGSGIRQITSGAGGRSLLPFRVNPARVGTRYRSNDAYQVEQLTLTVSQSSAGWQGGSWQHAFYRTDGSVVDQAAAGCWP